MSDRRYPKAVEKELIRLASLVSERESENRLREISSTVNRWKKKQAEANDALEAVRRLANAAPLVWSEGADPGVPVAHGLSMGLLKNDELTPSARKAIEVLVTLAEI